MKCRLAPALMVLVILIVMAGSVLLKHYYFKCPLAKFDFKVHIL